MVVITLLQSFPSPVLLFLVVWCGEACFLPRVPHCPQVGASETAGGLVTPRLPVYMRWDTGVCSGRCCQLYPFLAGGCSSWALSAGPCVGTGRGTSLLKREVLTA